jgi:hypothetical protein
MTFIALNSLGIIRNVGEIRGGRTDCVVRTTFEPKFPSSSMASVEIITKQTLVATVAVLFADGKKDTVVPYFTNEIPLSAVQLPYLNSAAFLEAISPDDRKDFDKAVKFFTKHLRKLEVAAVNQASTVQAAGMPSASMMTGGQITEMQQAPQAQQIEQTRTAELRLDPEAEAKQIKRVAKMNKIISSLSKEEGIELMDIPTAFPGVELSPVHSALRTLATLLNGGASK